MATKPTKPTKQTTKPHKQKEHKSPRQPQLHEIDICWGCHHRREVYPGGLCQACLREEMQARRASKLGLFVERVKHHEVWLRSGGVCYLCHELIHTEREMSWDHIIPLSQGGRHEYDNVAATHLKCN